MAVRIDASGDYLYRATNVPASSAFTLAGWLYLVTDRDATGAICQIINSGGTAGVVARVGADGTTLELFSNGSANSGSSLATGAWHHIALVKDGNNHYLYLNGALDITRVDATAWTSAYLILCQDGAWINGRWGQWRVWSAALGQEEIRAEMCSTSPVRTANLNAAYPFTSSTTADSSGNGNNMIAVGTPTLETPEPPVWAIVYGGLAGARLGAVGATVSAGSGSVDAIVPGALAAARLGGAVGAISGGANVLAALAPARAGAAGATISAGSVVHATVVGALAAARLGAGAATPAGSANVPGAAAGARMGGAPAVESGSAVVSGALASARMGAAGAVATGAANVPGGLAAARVGGAAPALTVDVLIRAALAAVCLGAAGGSVAMVTPDIAGRVLAAAAALWLLEQRERATGAEVDDSRVWRVTHDTSKDV